MLRQALGYCWSVAVAAATTIGKLAMERGLTSPDRDVQWVTRENLKKRQMVRMESGAPKG